ncbi:hypothetical protein H2203_009301 [Taxawa tesnikishii (nom. ined.)]|nr:hypothetical protein H2203_009301 [Dothideales sp. JES 119]
MKEDDAYEVKFSLYCFLQAINFAMITKKENFESDLYTKIIRMHLSDLATIVAFGKVMEDAAKLYISTNPLVATGSSRQYDSLDEYFAKYITFIVSSNSMIML